MELNHVLYLTEWCILVYLEFSCKMQFMHWNSLALEEMNTFSEVSNKYQTAGYMEWNGKYQRKRGGKMYLNLKSRHKAVQGNYDNNELQYSV